MPSPRRIWRWKPRSRASTRAAFDKLTGMAKAGCPVSKLLQADITLEAKLLA